MSHDRVDQLVRLFNCEYRDGRASTAPELRQNKQNAETSLIHTHTNVPSNSPTLKNDDPNNDSTAHDPDLLPHEYNDEDLDDLL